MTAVTGSGIRVMSDSLIAFQPAIDEPSNITPSAKVSSSMIDTSKVTCCHLPRGSVKRKSTYLTSLSLIALSTSFAFCILVGPLLPFWIFPGRTAVQLADLRSDRLGARLAGADPDRFDGALDHVVGDDDLELHLRQEVDDVLGAAVEFGVALLPAEPFRLDYGDALQPHLLERLLHLVELERLDDGFDLLHRGSAGRGAGSGRARCRS